MLFLDASFIACFQKSKKKQDKGISFSMKVQQHITNLTFLFHIQLSKDGIKPTNTQWQFYYKLARILFSQRPCHEPIWLQENLEAQKFTFMFGVVQKLRFQDKVNGWSLQFILFVNVHTIEKVNEGGWWSKKPKSCQRSL